MNRLLPATATTVLLLLAGCSSVPAPAEPRASLPAGKPSATPATTLLPGMPPPIDPADVYAGDRPGDLAAVAAHAQVKVDTAAQRVIGRLHLPGHAMPQDIKISPDGRTWYVADMQTSGLWLVDGDRMTVRTFIPTGDGAHGLCPSRDSRYLYIANRGAGSVSVLDFRTNRLVARWQLPGHASPDMGGVSADGHILWLSGRYDHEVYAIDTATGHLTARIPVGAEPHGLCVWPQPGRYSLGHTGILR